MTFLCKERYIAIVFGVGMVLTLTSGASAVSFNVTYDDPAGSGFYDADLGASRQAALGRALDAWSEHLTDNWTVSLSASFQSLGGSSTSATLAYGGPTAIVRNFSQAAQSNVWYPSALAEAISGRDYSSMADIVVVFNSDVDGSVLGSVDWSYQAEPSDGWSLDFQTVAMHEVAHGLGIFSTFNADGSWGYYGRPVVYDTLLVDAGGTRLIDKAADSDNVIGDVYFAGENAVAQWAAEGGTGDVPVYTPSMWEPGSSLSHLDETTFTGDEDLMTPYYDTPLREIDNVTLGVLDDLGWTVVYSPSVPEPATLLLLSIGATILLQRRRGGYTV